MAACYRAAKASGFPPEKRTLERRQEDKRKDEKKRKSIRRYIQILEIKQSTVANMATSDSNSVSKSGITVDAVTGERYIPSSVRADGSRRREIRVRPGYKPPEDVELYKNRAAAAWKSRNQGGGGVPGADGLKDDNNNDGAAAKTSTATTPATAASNKNAKRREAKKKAKAAGDESTPGGSGGKNVTEIADWRAFAAGSGDQNKEEATERGAEAKREAVTVEDQPTDANAENEKKARNLKKKLRQARDLNDKKDQGEALLPEQLEKVIKINELVRQLDSLGFDSNGDKRDTNADDNTENNERA